MATATTEAPDSLQTEESAEADAFAQLAEKFAGDESGQEAPAEPKGEEGEVTTDLSHSQDEPTEEAPAEPVAEPKAETEDDDDELPPELKDRISKRIGKVVAKFKSAQERAEALEAELAELRTKVKEPDAEAEPEKPRQAPVPQVPALQKIEQDIASIESTHNAAAEYLKRLRRDPDKVVAELQKKIKDAPFDNEDDAREWLETVKENTSREHNKLIARYESERSKYERQVETEREQTFTGVSKTYPWVADVRSGKDKKSPEAIIANRIRKEAAGLEDTPRGWQVIARLVRAEMAESADTAKPKGEAPKPPKLPTAPKAAAPAGKPQKVDITAIEKRLAASGSQEDAADLIAAKLF